MSATLLVILISVGALAFFVLAMSLTLIFKGHNIKSEISENENMRARGIKCVIQETREMDGEVSDDCGLSCGGNCADCSSEGRKVSEGEEG